MDFLLKNIRVLAIITILISIATWSLDLTGIVYKCNYCQIIRTSIGILGIIMLLPNPGHWFSKYISSIIAFFSMSVVAQLHFIGWRPFLNGEWGFQQPIYFDGFLLSGAALFIITAQILLIWTYKCPKN